MKKFILTLLLVFFSQNAFAQESGDSSACMLSYYAQKPEAFDICQPLAEKDSDIQKVLGDMYYWGWGTKAPQNYKKAALWYKRSSRGGNVDAKFNLGVLYEQGRGVPVDFLSAFKWFYSAARDGHVVAQFNSANMLSKGAGVAQNQSRAAKWYERAAYQGDVAAMYNIGNRYALGKGIRQNAILAYMWYTLAADQGDDAAKKNKNHIIQFMEPEHVAEAEDMARKWTPKNEALIKQQMRDDN